MNNKTARIGFIGSGNMAEAIIKELISSSTIPASRIIVSDRLETRLVYMAGAYEIKVSNSNAEVVRESDVIFITVKPHHVEDVLKGIAPELDESRGTDGAVDKLIISIAAGITTVSLLGALRQGGLKAAVPIVRAMPNIPVTVGEGMTVLTAGVGAGADELEAARGLFQAVGQAITLDDEGLIDAVTAISGSGPAYVFYFMEAFIQAGVKAGLPEDKARALVLQTTLGAAVMAVNSEKELAELRRTVTSPGGTTEAALKQCTSSDFNEIIERAVMAAKRRSEELSEGG